MAERIYCPVGHTCPDIDDVIGTIKNSVERLRSITSKPVNEIENEADDIAEELRNLYAGYTSELEKLRSQNSEIRNWGEGLEQEFNGITDELQEANNTIGRLESELEETRSELAEARRSPEAMAA